MADETPRIRIDLDAHQVWVDGHAVHFTTKQYGLLVALAANPGKAITRATLMDEVWGHTWGVDKSLDMHISAVRQKLQDDPTIQRCIATVRGVGWRLEPGTVEVVQQAAPPDLSRSPSRPAGPGRRRDVPQRHRHGRRTRGDQRGSGDSPMKIKAIHFGDSEKPQTVVAELDLREAAMITKAFGRLSPVAAQEQGLDPYATSTVYNSLTGVFDAYYEDGVDDYLKADDRG